MTPPLAGVYLRPLPDPLLPARHSEGARRRTGQLQGFLRELQAAAEEVLEPQGRAELLIVGRSDWRRSFRYPYGLPFTRTRGGTVSIVAAADYPSRLLRRFDEVRLEAARLGVEAPGDVREFLDLLVGHEWGHALANRSGVRTRVKWLDEFMATYLFLQALKATGADEVLERVVGWAELLVAGSVAGRTDLGVFEYPRGRLSFEHGLWFQGVFTERAAELLGRGWELPLAVRAALPAGPGRGDVARALLGLEPSFRDWFGLFGRGPEAVGGEGH